MFAQKSKGLVPVFALYNSVDDLNFYSTFRNGEENDLEGNWAFNNVLGYILPAEDFEAPSY